MEIASAFNSGLQGFQNAQATADQTAADIVASTTVSSTQENSTTNTGEVNTEVNITNSAAELPDLNKAIVNLKVAEYQAKASAQVIKSADETLGTLLDITA